MITTAEPVSATSSGVTPLRQSSFAVNEIQVLRGAKVWLNGDTTTSSITIAANASTAFDSAFGYYINNLVLNGNAYVVCT